MVAVALAVYHASSVARLFHSELVAASRLTARDIREPELSLDVCDSGGINDRRDRFEDCVFKMDANDGSFDRLAHCVDHDTAGIG